MQRFPLDIVFRIFDNCLASGIEAIFGFGLALLHKNEEKLLKLKFDEIVAFLNTQIVDTYKVRLSSHSSVELIADMHTGAVTRSVCEAVVPRRRVRRRCEFAEDHAVHAGFVRARVERHAAGA